MLGPQFISFAVFKLLNLILNWKMPLKTYVIACAVLAIDMKLTARKLGKELEFKFLEAGLHNNPKLLFEKLQTAIDEISARGDGDRIIIGYGICGKGTIGIKARNIPLVIPKVHDCISLFLGGDREYKEQFTKFPGTYYLTAGWCEEKAESMSQRRQQAYFGSEKFLFKDLVKSHGKEAATQTFNFLNSWQKNYQRAAFIETNAGNSAKYEAHAREMAEEYNWEYAKIKGSQALIQKIITQKTSTPEILVVPPTHVIGFDPISSTLSANPVWDSPEKSMKAQEVTITQYKDQNKDQDQDKNKDQNQGLNGTAYIKTGLGIDAGGTYTDAVVYDLETRTTLCKAKSLTTKWDFTIGIGKALKKLDQKQLMSVELVALSTTLATNAIVENQGQKVGMILMASHGLSDNISHRPKALIKGKMDISGKEENAVDHDEIRKAADQMIQHHDVTAFAVSGYAGSINPAQELEVKQILMEHTNLFVTCGHELSDTLNFQTRATTAMLNARIIPRLTALLLDLEKVMKTLGIKAPIVVVKGDGTLMGSEMAKKRPVETILSGPAASVAGARHLTGITNALVVDMGGTTTDTAALADNQVSLNESGSNVGGHRTHVKALEIRTSGLGGDSGILFEQGQFSIGPNRVAPIAWLGATQPDAAMAIDFLSRNMSRYNSSTKKMQILTLTGSVNDMATTPVEEKMISLLKIRPHSIDELVLKMELLSEASLPLNRLEEKFVIQRCGLTLTDLLHITGQFVKWDKNLAHTYCSLFSFLSKKEIDELVPYLITTGVNQLTLELLKRQLDNETNPDVLHTCPVCKVFMDNLLSGGNDSFAMTINLKQPIIGIGAPTQFFLPRAAKTLGSEAILPEDADVANAIGAITSNVVVQKQMRIIPGEQGGFIVEGIAGTRQFRQFEDADAFARDALTQIVLNLALAAGTSSRTVELKTRDQIPKTLAGEAIFMGRIIMGSLTGRPDLVGKEMALP
jgi:N-methylhydantoinase A/oxoprolinase/acetone carboxylase beta subunit